MVSAWSLSSWRPGIFEKENMRVYRIQEFGSLTPMVFETMKDIQRMYPDTEYHKIRYAMQKHDTFVTRKYVADAISHKAIPENAIIESSLKEKIEKIKQEAQQN